MMLLVRHYNLIGHEINESLNEHPASDREVYCKRFHTIKEPDIDDCVNCPYYGGVMGGYGHECVWEDEWDLPYYDDMEISKAVKWEDRQKELLRVSNLIDKGVLKKG